MRQTQEVKAADAAARRAADENVTRELRRARGRLLAENHITEEIIRLLREGGP